MAQSGIGQNHMNKCGHAGCACLVDPSQTYCSDYCVTASGADASNQLPGHQSESGRCECGHAACQQRVTP